MLLGDWAGGDAGGYGSEWTVDGDLFRRCGKGLVVGADAVLGRVGRVGGDGVRCLEVKKVFHEGD